MDQIRILENILSRGASGFSLAEMIQSPALAHNYEETPPEEKISDFYEILEHVEKNERWASGITTYQISRFRLSIAKGEFYTVEETDPSNLVLRKNVQTCAVCLTVIKTGELIRELPCSHTFHKKCVDHWLKIRATCPIDRMSMLGK
ncbi:hypothetical protein SteCoe_21735 [Stentor coeruleus]|uniref:RING-type domain-containing protein n=1 Tax=Stentor coeruleus TaxID=5963 RepID=A0A1R2BP18_9CILI|nr:hypothetical protein SteCoe_21735 [Stentor coeruleus]